MSGDPTPPTCENNLATIRQPEPFDTILPGLFDVIGSAAPPRFDAYLFTLQPDASAGSENAGRGEWVLQNPMRKPVINGTLVRGVTIRDIAEGRYVLRLLVRLSDGTLLPPCDVIVRFRR
jgi:hypothetical protein